MIDMLVETLEENEYRLKIYMDNMAPNPREEGDCHIGRMTCWHGRRVLGDDMPRSDPRKWLDDMRAEHGDEFIALPLYLYDHGGLTMSTSPFSCPWDSGLVGWVHALQTITEEAIGRPSSREEIEKWLQGEVEEYNYWLTGEVYRFELFCKDIDGEWKLVDSCCGFYGPKETNGLLETAGWPEITKEVPPLRALCKEFERRGGKEEDLDEAVHETASGIASDINNSGVEKQVLFLVENLGEEATRTMVLLAAETGDYRAEEGSR